MGFTRVDNWLFDVVMPNASPNAYKVVSAVVRLTIGWQKEEALITFDDFHKVTGIKGRGTLNRAIEEAADSGFIERSGSTRKIIYSIKMILTEDNEIVPESYQLEYQNSTKDSTEIVPSTIYKEKEKKRKKEKHHPRMSKPNHPQWKIPPSLDTPEFEAAWINWYKHLLEKNRPLTQTAGDLELERLEKMGLERALVAINHSIRARAVNIYEQNSNNNSIHSDIARTAWKQVSHELTTNGRRSTKHWNGSIAPVLKKVGGYKRLCGLPIHEAEKLFENAYQDLERTPA